MRFELGPGAECDLDALIESRLLVQANSGGGKSWLLRRLLEQTFGHVQHLVIDPEGEFSSLRERYDYVLAAPRGGDTTAEPRAAKLLAQRLLELNVSAILDIYELKAHDRVRFVRYFLEALVDAPKALWHPALVIIDEAHVYCPQKGDAESAGAVIDLATRGRKRGFCSVIATQRLSKLHKDAAAECNNKLIGRSSLDVDMRRASEELGFAGREEQHQLRELEPGEFFAFGPALSRVVTKAMIGPVETQHPKTGGRQASAPPPPTEKVRALLPQLSDLPAEAEAERKSLDDLKRDNAELRRKLTVAAKDAPPPSEELIASRVAAGVAQVQRAAERETAEVARRVAVLENVVGSASRELIVMGERLAKATNGTIPKPVARTPVASAPPAPPKPRPAPPVGEPGDLSGIRSGAQRILRELARRHPLTWTKAQVAQLTGFTASGGTFTTYLGDLKRAGLILVERNDVRVTDAGLDAAGEVPSAPATHDEVMAMWRDKMRSGEFRLLEAIAEAGEDGIDKAALAEATEFTMTGGTFSTYIGTLRRNGLISVEAGQLVPSPMLWPEGLA